ncbi:indole-3-glycerol-phosphate synthase [Actinomyces slackii]|uniref:indole-3-glycerol-phosphate synthase n=1 Tax=Actinomyces slackii TaxID=52774 RepID=A0A448KDZ4_9ACTO|nr:indole-3-glycerol phosphate synthase TrpC [Actinomyces slackii]VEG75122.1 Indole-3-glycerol phosphate synthase [Actinomyces slackii]
MAAAQEPERFARIAADARAAAESRARRVPMRRLKEMARRAPGARDARTALCAPDRAVSVIAEVKRSAATFADLSGAGAPGMLARFYAAGGAACVSVVTDPHRCDGSLEDLDAVREAIDVPVLAHDLVVTPYQVHEARAHGADLLMLDARLEPLILEGLIERVHSLGMSAVVQVRTRREALTAIETGGRMIAVDTRDPQTRQVDRSRFDQVAEVLPAGITRIVAGGVLGPHDVMDLARSGADVVLAGEAILRSTDPQQFVAELVAAGAHPSLLHVANREAR